MRHTIVEIKCVYQTLIEHLSCAKQCTRCFRMQKWITKLISCPQGAYWSTEKYKSLITLFLLKYYICDLLYSFTSKLNYLKSIHQNFVFESAIINKGQILGELDTNLNLNPREKVNWLSIQESNWIVWV